MVPHLLPKNGEMETMAEVVLEDLLEVKEYFRNVLLQGKVRTPCLFTFKRMD